MRKVLWRGLQLLIVLVLVATAAAVGPTIAIGINPFATLQRAKHLTGVIVFTGQSPATVTMKTGETATLTGTWQIDGQTVYVTKTVTTDTRGSFYVELRPSASGIELLDVPTAKFVVNVP